MIYVNKRTGATIDSPCLLSGEDWECVSEAATVEEMETVEEAAETEEVAEKAEEAKEEKPKKRNNKKGE